MQIKKASEMFAAIAAEPRLQTLRLLFAAHPLGLTVTEIQASIAMPGSTRSHHLDRLKSQDLVQVRREGTFLRYSANVVTIQHLLGFLARECDHLGTLPTKQSKAA